MAMATPDSTRPERSSGTACGERSRISSTRLAVSTTAPTTRASTSAQYPSPYSAWASSQSTRAVAFPSRSPRPDRVMSGGAAATVSGSAKMATGQTAGNVAFMPRNSIAATPEAYPSIEAAVGTLDELASRAVRDVSRDVGDHPGTDGDERIGRRSAQHVVETVDARLVGEQAVALREAQRRCAGPPRRKLPHDAGPGRLRGVRVHDDERVRPAPCPDEGAELVERALLDDDRLDRHAVDRPARAARGSPTRGPPGSLGRGTRSGPSFRVSPRTGNRRRPPGASRGVTTG